MAYLTAFIEIFRFIKRYRERQAERLNAHRAEAASERAHQLAMLNVVADKLVEFTQSQQSGQLEIARALTAQADVMATWLKGFQISDPSPAPPQVVRDEDQWMRENSGSVLDHLPPEFALALKLQQEQNENFDREGSDFPIS